MLSPAVMPAVDATLVEKAVTCGEKQPPHTGTARFEHSSSLAGAGTRKLTGSGSSSGYARDYFILVTQ